VWAVGYAATKRIEFRVPRTLARLKATADFTEMGEVGFAPDGVFDHGTHEEDGPGTWEALVSPREELGFTESR
jgi:hypothetical protein